MAIKFVDMSKGRQVWAGIGGAVVSGAICGALATTNVWAYLAALLITVVGGLGAGAQHRTLRGSMIRGAVAGGLWPIALIIAVELSGRDPIEGMPKPLGLILIYGIVATIATCSAVWALANRRDQHNAPIPTSTEI